MLLLSFPCHSSFYFLFPRSHVFSEEAVSLLLDEIHVVFVPGPGGPQHVSPAQHQDIQALSLQLRHHRQQLKRTHLNTFIDVNIV